MSRSSRPTFCVRTYRARGGHTASCGSSFSQAMRKARKLAREPGVSTAHVVSSRGDQESVAFCFRNVDLSRIGPPAPVSVTCRATSPHFRGGPLKWEVANTRMNVSDL